MHLVQFDPAIKGQGGQDSDFISGIEAIDISTGVGFGIAQLLGIGEDLGKVAAFLLHPGENIVGRAIENAGDGANAVGPQGLFQGLNHRNPASDGSFEHDVHPRFIGRRENFIPIPGNHRFVGCHHMLPLAIASRIRVRAGSRPPITSTTISTAGSVTMALRSVVNRSGGS